MNGIFNGDLDLRNASLEEIRQTMQELHTELRFRLSSLSAENFPEKELPALARLLLGSLGIVVRKGVLMVDGRAVAMAEEETEEEENDAEGSD